MRKEQYINYISKKNSQYKQKQLYFEAQRLIDDAIINGEFDGVYKKLYQYNDVATCGKLI
jgi:hypothetical protein